MNNKYTQRQFSTLTGIARNTLRNWAKAGRLVPAIEENGKKYYSAAQSDVAHSLLDFSKSHPKKPKAATPFTNEQVADTGHQATFDELKAAGTYYADTLSDYINVPDEDEPDDENDDNNPLDLIDFGEAYNLQSTISQLVTPEVKAAHVDETPSHPTIENLPAELLSQARFFAVRIDEKGNKCPCIKQWTNPANQKRYNSFVAPLKGFDTCGHGVADDYLFFDFDDVLNDNGQFVNQDAAQWFYYILNKFKDCFNEISISGHGLHILARPTPDKFGTITTRDGVGVLYFDKANNVKLEIFYKSAGRYCLMTGNLFQCKAQARIPEGEIVDEVLSAVLDEIKRRSLPTPPTSIKAENSDKSARLASDSNFAPLGDDYDKWRADKMLDVIPLKDLSGDDWLAVVSALKTLGYSYEEVDALNQGGEHYNERMNKARWDSALKPTFDIATLHGYAKRYGYVEKDAQREWYQLHPELSKKNDCRADSIADSNIDVIEIEDVSEDTTKHFIEDCPIALRVPESFIFDNSGIKYKCPPKKKGDEEKLITVSRTPLVVTKVFREPTKDDTQYELGLKIRKKWRRVILDGQITTDTRYVHELAKKGALIESTGHITKYLTRLIAINGDKIPEIKCYRKPGWYDDEYIYPAPPVDAEYICKRSGIDYPALFATRGNPDEWLNKLRDVQKNLFGKAIVGAAALAPLLNVLGLPNCQVHVEGRSNFAKSPVVKFALSIYGNPTEGKLFRSFDSSPKNRIAMAVGFNDLPQGLDELESLSRRDEDSLSTSVYNFFAGIDGQKNKRNGDVREAENFRGVRISTGERPLLRVTDKRGMFKRVLPIQLTSPLMNDADARDLHIFLKTNHGHFGRKWVEYIKANAAQIKDDFEAVVADIETHGFYREGYVVDKPSSIEPTLFYWAVGIIVANAHFRVCSGLDETFDKHLAGDARKLIATLPTQNEISDTQRAILLLASYVDEHPKNFIHEVPPIDLRDIDEPAESYQRTVGKIFKDTRVAFFGNSFRDVIEKDLGLPSYEKLLNEFYAEGIIDCPSRREKARLINISGSKKRAYLFKAGTLISPADNEDKDDIADETHEDYSDWRNY